MLVCLITVALVARAFAFPENFNVGKFGNFENYDDEQIMHPKVRHERSINRKKFNVEETLADYWRKDAQLSLNEKLSIKQNTNIAKNVIFFLGDGMSIPTVTASRIYLGQMKNRSGEESHLAFDRFPYTGLSKTYCVDRQVADSACTATAYLCGVKANYATIGVSGQVPLGDCEASTDTSRHVDSIARWSQLKGKRTGIVTTTRVTHASPAGAYANTAHRDWESDYDVTKANVDPKKCRDIAYQLIHGETGKNFNVILGGGRRKFLPKTETDEEDDEGERLDKRNLIKEWLKQKEDQERNAQYVWNRDGLLQVSSKTDSLLGLFESSHCAYNLDANKTTEPTLAEMTEAAIKILNKGPYGYFLFVEGGRIDHAHHSTLARKSLDETVQFSEAIQKAVDMTNSKDTLIVVTSDHAHTMSFSGYPKRGNDILGNAGKADDDKPYSTLLYANGPSYYGHYGSEGRHDLDKDDKRNKDYIFPAAAPLSAETHGGDDVGIFASGPWAHLFTGVLQQNVIPHTMAYASCVGNGITACDQDIRK